jgi:chromosome segregation ATPase
VAPINHEDLLTRLAVVETTARALKEELRDDLRDLRREVHDLREAVQRAHSPLSRNERAAYAAVGIGLISAIVAALSLILRAPG